VSPDGKHVAFLRRDPEGNATYVAELDGTHARRLGPATMTPIWSADSAAIWLGSPATLVAIETGKRLRTLPVLPNARTDGGVELPDGRLVMLEAPDQSNETAVGVALYDGAGVHWLVQAALLPAIALAPDGTAVLVAHVTETGTRELWSVPLDGKPPSAISGPIQPTNGIAVHDHTIAWSSCEPRMLLGKLTGDPLHLVPLASGTWVDQKPSAVPHTQQIVVVSDRDRALRLWVIDLAHEQAPRELPEADNEPGSAAVSVDGTLVYSVDSQMHLLVQPLDGSHPPTKLADKVAGTPAPRRDGSIVATILTSPTTARLDVIPKTGPARMLVAEGSVPAASPVSDDLYYVDDNDLDDVQST